MVAPERVDQLRGDVEAHLRAAGIRPYLVAAAGIDSSDLRVILQSHVVDPALALAVVEEVDGVRCAAWQTGTPARSILLVELHP